MKFIKNSYFSIVYLITLFVFLFFFLVFLYSDIVVKNLLQIYANSSNSFNVEIGKLEKASFDEYFLDNLNISTKNNMVIDVKNLLINFNFYNFIFNREIIESLYLDDLVISYKKNFNDKSSIKFPNLGINNFEIKNISVLTDSSNHSFNLKSSLNIFNNEITIKIDTLHSKTLFDKKIIFTNTDILIKNDSIFFNVNNTIENTNIILLNGELYKNKNQFDFHLNYINFQDLRNNFINVNLNDIRGSLYSKNNVLNINANYKLNSNEIDANVHSVINIKDKIMNFNSDIYNENLKINLDGDYNHNNKIWKLYSNIKKINYNIFKDSITLSGDVALFGDSNKIITSNMNIESSSSNQNLNYNSIKAKINYKYGIFTSTGPIVFNNKNTNISIADLFYNLDSLNFNSDINFNNYNLFLNKNYSFKINGMTNFNLSKVNDNYKFQGESYLKDIKQDNIEIDKFNITFNGLYKNKDLYLDANTTLSELSNNYQDIDSMKFKFYKNESKYQIKSFYLHSNFNDSLYINNMIYKNDNYFQVNEIIGNFFGPSINIPSIYLNKENNYYNFSETPIQINNGTLKINGKINRFNNYDLSFILSDINLIDLNKIFNNGQRIDGLINGKIHIVNKTTNPFFLSNFTVEKGSFDDFVFDEIQGNFAYRNKKLFVSKLNYKSNDSNLFLEGWLSMNNLFSDMNLIDENDSLNFNINTDSFELDKLNNYIPINNNLGGFLDSNGSVKGIMKDLDIYMDTEVNGFIFDKLRADKIKGDFIYENSQLYLKAFNFLNENERYTVSGSFPININFINMDKNLSELPLNILITGKSNNFNLLTSNIDNVEYLNGDISIQLSIGGNYKRPIRNGQLIIRNGTLSLLNINNTFNDINGIGILSNNKLVIENLSAKTNINNNKKSFFENARNNLKNIFNRKNNIESSLLNLYGSINLNSFFKPDYSIILKGKNIFIEDTKENFIGRGDIDLAITGKDTVVVNGQFIPDPNNFKIISEFNSQDRGDLKINDKIVYKYYLDLPLQNGIKIENSLMDLYMDGYLNLSSFNNEPLKYSGELNIIEGSFFYNGNEFTNIEGNIYLEPTNFNPELNIYGSTNIAGEEIDVAFVGPLDNPSLSLESYNNFSQSDIIELLLFRDNKETKLTPNDQIENFISNYFENELERNISKYTFLNKFQFNSSGSLLSGIEDKDLDLYVGANISTKLFMNYKRDIFSNQNDAEYEIGYRMNRNMSIVAKIDENKLLNLNYRIRYHYK